LVRDEGIFGIWLWGTAMSSPMAVAFLLLLLLLFLGLVGLVVALVDGAVVEEEVVQAYGQRGVRGRAVVEGTCVVASSFFPKAEGPRSSEDTQVNVDRFSLYFFAALSTRGRSFSKRSISMSLWASSG
jgi:hypothetical protein